ncbi:Uncharacterised protein [Nocardia otitidiscaviarum]|uniref:Uncharacterized protein n=1 Tax=Nocardia otitidiscaviarum TaxID=1823 RepID=A0A379JML2_9NOCA|nr:hypothetical protein [Nocardia otitidiscaviarum]SUD49596.1 Uncharacterised protein [Nocardia otitidiscaviarum]
MLPELPTTPITTIGTVRSIGGATVIVLDYAAPRGPRRGCRYRVDPIDAEPGTTGCTRVVFHLDGRAALRPPPWAQQREVGLRLRALPDRRAHQIPRDLAAALETAAVTIDHLTDADLTQMVEMVIEAHDPAVRAARITAVVTAVAATADQAAVQS